MSRETRMSAELRRARFVTLGCKVNQYETQHVKEALEGAGFREARDGEPADLCVVNTCTVTHEGDAKSRQAIRRLHHEQPRAPIVVMGCYATRDPDAVGRLPGVTQVVVDKATLPEAMRVHGVDVWPAGITRFDGHQRAFVKVQDGCLLSCSYCIIPSVRPRLASRPVNAVADEVAGLVARGTQEVVLTGVHLGHYGLDLSKGRPKAEWRRLWHLLEALNALPGDFRIRLSSLEAAEARDDLVRAVAALKKVVPHLHLCLQSGSDRVLARMRRRSRVGPFLQRVERIRRELDRPALTTDLIVGFPGETDADFEETLTTVRHAGFARIHVFTYSPRAGTPAASLGDPVTPAVARERRERLGELGDALAAEYRRSLVGADLSVMVEGEDPARPGHVLGTACRYVPVTFPGHAPALVGRLVPIRAVAEHAGVLLGTPTPDASLAAPGRRALALVGAR